MEPQRCIYVPLPVSDIPALFICVAFRRDFDNGDYPHETKQFCSCVTMWAVHYMHRYVVVVISVLMMYLLKKFRMYVSVRMYTYHIL